MNLDPALKFTAVMIVLKRKAPNLGLKTIQSTSKFYVFPHTFQGEAGSTTEAQVV